MDFTPTWGTASGNVEIDISDALTVAGVTTIQSSPKQILTVGRLRNVAFGDGLALETNGTNGVVQLLKLVSNGAPAAMTVADMGTSNTEIEGYGFIEVTS